MRDWCERRDIPYGATLSLERCWELAVAWYSGRAEFRWRGRSTAETKDVLHSIGLNDEFWTLEGTA